MRYTPGPFEQAVLLTILRLGDDAYGVAIHREVSDRLRRNISWGAVYTTLQRLQAKGFISSFMAGKTATRGGRAKRYYTIENDGKRALEDAWATIQRLWQ